MRTCDISKALSVHYDLDREGNIKKVVHRNFLTVSEFADAYGITPNKAAAKLKEWGVIPAEGKRYFIPDIAEQITKRGYYNERNTQ